MAHGLVAAVVARGRGQFGVGVAVGLGGYRVQLAFDSLKQGGSLWALPPNRFERLVERMQTSRAQAAAVIPRRSATSSNSSS